MLVLIILIAIIVATIIVFEPNIDITTEKEVLLWFNNSGYKRKFIKLFNL